MVFASMMIYMPLAEVETTPSVFVPGQVSLSKSFGVCRLNQDVPAATHLPNLMLR